MSKIKIESNSSGTGVITLVSPNTNTDRTVTLPDESITLGGGVDGIVSTANATAITIDSSERVGIGITTPNATLHLKSSSTNLPVFKLENTYESGGGTPTVTGNAPIIELYANDSGTGQPDSQELGIIEFRGSNKDSGSEELYSRIVGTNGDANTTGEIIFETQQSNVMTQALTLRGDRGLSQFTAKAWVNFAGTDTPAIRDSHNVSSITDNGTGLYTVNYTNNMANVNYSNVGSVQGDTKVFTLTSVAVGSSQVEIRQSTNGVTADVGKVCMQVFGD